MSYPDPAPQSLETRVADRLKPLLHSESERGAESNPTIAAIHFRQIVDEEKRADEPTYYGGNARRRLRMIERRRGRGKQ